MKLKFNTYPMMFNGEIYLTVWVDGVRLNEIQVSVDGSVRVWDDTAGFYTLAHALPPEVVAACAEHAEVERPRLQVLEATWLTRYTLEQSSGELEGEDR